MSRAVQIPILLNAYSVPWWPSLCVAHVRLQLGADGDELMHIQTPETPCRVSPRSNRYLVERVELGRATMRQVRDARALVDPCFRVYHVVRANCMLYAFCMASALFGEEQVSTRFPFHVNSVLRCIWSWDYVRTNISVGCVPAVVHASDPKRAFRSLLQVPTPWPQVAETLLDRLLHEFDMTCDLRRDPAVRASAKVSLGGNSGAWMAFCWQGLCAAVRVRRSLCCLACAKLVPF